MRFVASKRLFDGFDFTRDFAFIAGRIMYHIRYALNKFKSIRRRVVGTARGVSRPPRTDLLRGNIIGIMKFRKEVHSYRRQEVG